MKCDNYKDACMHVYTCSNVLHVNMDVMHVIQQYYHICSGEKYCLLSVLELLRELLKHLLCEAKPGLCVIAVITLGSLRRQGVVGR